MGTPAHHQGRASGNPDRRRGDRGTRTAEETVRPIGEVAQSTQTAKPAQPKIGDERAYRIVAPDAQRPVKTKPTRRMA
jgi:hypothetical protein